MKKILIAEDDQNIGAALEIRLKATGYAVQVLQSGFGSYLQAMTDPPDLILMDIFMPAGNGLDVAQELQRTGLAAVPIIFMTASKERDLRERAEALNAAGFFEKPFDTKQLLAAVSQTLQSTPAPGEGIPK